MIDVVIGAMVGAIVGVIAFVVVKSIVQAQDTSLWTAAEQAIIGTIPIAIGVLVLVIVFSSLQLRRT